jgi:hypothetical protein
VEVVNSSIMEHGIFFLPFLQGLYFLVTGLWPLVSMSTFLKVTGPKNDLWLVKTVGLLLALIGTILVLAAFNIEVPQEVALLGMGTALILGAIDTIYAALKTIAPIYLLDAVLECIFLVAWSVFLISSS